GLYAPAQVLTDFLANRQSAVLPVTSYKPGVKSSLISGWLPEWLYGRLATGLRDFGRKAPGFVSNWALLLGVETRTSSPVRIPRNDKLIHPEVEGLYPCGEGAGYAGGIVSAAMDGEKCAESIAGCL
ncbi:MAG: FAD-binding protein, partial [Odoribacter sp.]|nr:FAD-binding protein [Odoribacter sp.]